MNKLKNTLYVLLAIFILYLIIGFFVAPKILKDLFIENLDKNLNAKTKIEKIYFNPLTLEAKILDFALLDENNEKIVAFDKLYLDLAFLQSIEKKHIRVDNISLDGIFLNIIEQSSGVLNLNNLIKESNEAKVELEEDKSESSFDIQYLISKIVLKDANIDFTSFTNKQTYSLRLKDINYAIYDLGNYKNSLSSNSLKFLLNKSTLVEIGGGLKLEPFLAYGQISIKDLKIKDILDFDKSLFNFSINEDANLNLVLNYSIDINDGLNLKLHTDILNLNNIKLNQNKSEIITLKQLDIGKLFFDLNSQTIKIDDIFFKDLISKMILDKKGINFANLVNIKPSTSQTKSVEKSKNNTPWIVWLNNIDLKAAFYFTDSLNNTTLNIDSINTKVNHIKVIDSQVELQGANIATSSTNYKDSLNNFDLASKNTNIKLDNLLVKNGITDIKNISLIKNGIFFNDNNSKLKSSLNVLNLDLQNLNISDEIKFSLANIKADNLNFQDLNSKISVDSKNTNIKLDSFLLDKSNNILVKKAEIYKTTLDFFDANSSLKVDTKDTNIVLDNFNFNLKKESIVIAQVSIKEPLVDVLNIDSNLKIEAKKVDLKLTKIISKENFFKIGKTELNNPILSIVLAKKSPIKEQKDEIKTQTVENSNNKFRLILGPVDIKDMSLDFEDKNLPIPFKSRISKLNGQISDIKNKAQSTSQLEIKGVVDEYGVAKITGTVNPNNIKILTDINMKFQNIAMNSFTPYTAKFVGREIKDGKLELDLNYNITESNLKAKNSIIIKKLVLGNAVQSPEAISLPLDLAIALLEDSSNKIDINLPISGNIDDPQFSVASIVWKAFINLITKAITSPFSLIGSLFNFNEDEIKSVNFELKQSEISPIQKETLDKIALILSKKEDIAIKFSPSFDEKNEKESFAKERAINIKNYLINEKSIHENQVIINSEIKKSSSTITLDIQEIK